MKVLYIFLVSIFLISATQAQETYQVLKSESSILIKGTSSVHDWESNAEEFDGVASILIKDGSFTSFEGLSFSVASASIKSGKRIMDSKTRDALNAKKYPQITFDFLSLEGIDQDTVHVLGNLTLAGTTKKITLSGAYEITDGAFTVSGEQPIDMEDFDIKPPTAMMGALKTGKDVDVEYRITFSKN